jgi:hypothetical protein
MSRRGWGDDGVYFDHRTECRDALHHKGCNGRWRGVVSRGFGPDGKHFRKKVSGTTKTEVKDKLKALHSELSAGLRTSHSYTVEKAVDDWLETGLPGQAEKTVEANRDSLRPLLASIGRMPLAELTAHDVRAALDQLGVSAWDTRRVAGRRWPGGHVSDLRPGDGAHAAAGRVRLHQRGPIDLAGEPVMDDPPEPELSTKKLTMPLASASFCNAVMSLTWIVAARVGRGLADLGLRDGATFRCP